MSSSGVEPLVSYPTGSSSESVLTVLQMYDNGTYAVADFQRDSDQWDEEKKSLFIESVLNNLTVPSFFLAATTAGKFEIIDGQQRLTTLKEFHSNMLRLVGSNEADYLPQRSIHYAGRTFEELKASSPSYARAFEGYLLSLIKLPQDVSGSTRREVFRRINEAGTPLSAQDIRLAYWGQCKPVALIRLAGIYDETREGAKRMIEVARADYDAEWPWGTVNETIREGWRDWWMNRQTAIGQTASEMFLWYLVSMHSSQIDSLLTNTPHLASALNATFDGRTEEVADIFCAQLLYESNNPGSQNVLCTSEQIERDLFPAFAKWWYELHSRMPNIGVDRNRRMALLVWALSRLGHEPESMKPDHWDQIESFLRSPRQTASRLDIDVPEAKGRWGGERGQRAQIEAYHAVAQRILSVP